MAPHTPSAPVTARASGLTAFYFRDAPEMMPAGLSSGPRIIVERQDSCVQVSPAISPARLSGDSIVLVLDAEWLKAAREVSEQVSCDPFLYGIAHSMRCGFRYQVSPPPEFLESLVRPIADHLRDFYARHGTRRPGPGLSPSRLTRALEHIETNLAGPCTLEELAEVVHLSVFHFCRMFRRCMGRSPHQYLMDRRMARARDLLGKTDTLIADIARQVGFRTQSHFTNAFKNAHSISPGVYRSRAG